MLIFVEVTRRCHHVKGNSKTVSTAKANQCAARECMLGYPEIKIGPVAFMDLSTLQIGLQEGLAVASIARDVVVEMTPPRDDNAR